MTLNSLTFDSLTTGASVKLTGRLVPSPGQEQQQELQVDQVEVLGECDSVSHCRYQPSFLRSYSYPYGIHFILVACHVDLSITKETTYCGILARNGPSTIKR
jgi:aspartyl/asparaginyl-tRNA synthetase